MDTDSGYYSIIDYVVDGPATQRELVAAFAEIQERWVRFHPGYRSARFLVSTDGTRVRNIVHWASEHDLRTFEANSDIDGLMAAIQNALDSLPATTETQMSRYTVLREVAPGPQRTDS